MENYVANLKKSTAISLSGDQLATHIEVVTSPNCPYSEEAVEIARRVITRMTSVIFTEVSTITSEGQEIAESYGVRNTPAVIINGKLVNVGLPEADELKRHILGAVKEEQHRLNYFF